MAENDKLALYIKEEIAGIRVVNKESGYVWGSLENEDPENLNNTWGAFAQSIVSISYMDITGTIKQIGAGDKKAECEFRYFENGVTCKVDFGRKVGCPTPMNDKVVEIIHDIEQGKLTPSFDNLKLF